MKAYVADFNNILLDVKSRVELASDVRDADVLILWQDVRGGLKTLCDINRDYMRKPVVVVQHGRGATRDYLEPNNFKLTADRICVWGEAEADRMAKAGYADRVVVTGSPLVKYVRENPLVPHEETIVVFAPVITSHEEPDNLEVFYELKKIEYEFAQEALRSKKDLLKKGWHAWFLDERVATENQVPYDLLRRNFLLVSKLTDIHDQKLYHGVTVKTSPINISHLEESIKLLRNADLVIGMEEGTFQLMATAYGIPTIIVDGFKYGSYGGVDNYDRMEVIRSKATAFCDLASLKSTICYELLNRQSRQEAREEVTRREFDPFPDKDPIESIIDVASELAGGDIRNQEKVIHGGCISDC